MRRAAQLLAVLSVVALVATMAVAGGKKPPGGDDPSTGGGTIYYEFSGQVWTMNSDGTDKTPLPVSSGGEPSRQLHDGRRWFLTLQDVGTYGPRPDGSPAPRPRYELFAVCDDGITEPQQLTFSESLEELELGQGRPRWAFDDSRVSWIARGWDDPLTGSVIEGGIYSLEIDFSAGTPQPAGSPVLVVPGDLYYCGDEGGTIPLIGGHDWSPEGESVVYARLRLDGPPVLSVADTTDPSASWDLTDGNDPEWSPDGTTIAFVLERECWTIGADGQDQQLVFAKTDKQRSWDEMKSPSWSPTASHLACTRQTFGLWWWADVLRAGADGSDQTNLTGDLNTKRLGLYALLLGWR